MRRVGYLLVLLFIFLTSCKGSEIPTANSAPTASSQPGKGNLTPLITQRYSEVDQAPVLKACNFQEQKRTLLAGNAFDWHGIPLNACYQLSMELDPASSSYTGTARITYTNLTNETLPDLVLRLYPNAKNLYNGELLISSVKIADKEVKPEIFLPDQTAVRLPLEEALLTGKTIEVAIDFSGKIPVDYGSSSNVYGIFNHENQKDVITLANWYPILATREAGAWRTEPVLNLGDAVVSDTALYQVEIAVPQDWLPVTSGVEIGRRVTNGISHLVYISGPMRDFALSASPAFKLKETELDGVRLRLWGLPGGESRWSEALQAASDSLALYDQKFGGYPYTELDVAAVPLQIASGVEYPGMILINADLYLPDLERPFFLNQVVAHEVAHQWWYGVVGNDVIQAPWQDEALATFSQMLYVKANQPQYYSDTLEYFQVRMNEVEEGSFDTHIAQSAVDFQDHPKAYSAVVYLKGALFFQALQEKIGEDVFFQALQDYFKDNAYTIAAPQSLLGAFEDACNCDLSSFYREWGLID